jgi:putative transposase
MERPGLSQRHACRLVDMDRSTLRYRGKRAGRLGASPATARAGRGAPPIRVSALSWMLAREGQAMNHRRLYRLYREERLMVRRRGPRKRTLGTRAPILLPRAINQRWSLDFVSDALGDGRCFRILWVVDDFAEDIELVLQPSR